MENQGLDLGNSGSQTSTDNQAPNPSQDTQSQNQEHSIPEIESLGKFKFQGKEWTPEELNKAYLLQQDYSKKTQALSEDRKYYDNLAYDLRAVEKNPELAAAFKKAYPAKFHKYLDDLTTPETQTASDDLDPRIQREIEKLRQELGGANEFITKAREEAHQKQVEVFSQTLDNWEKTYGAKFPMADIDSIYAKLEWVIGQNQLAAQKGENPFKITDGFVERLYKESHANAEKKYTDWHKQKLSAQDTKAKRAFDPPSGGASSTKAQANDNKPLGMEGNLQRILKQLNNR